MKRWRRRKAAPINSKSMKRILVLLLATSAPFLLFGQFSKYEKSDSLFKCYKAPDIKRTVFNQLEKDDAIIYIGCYYTTDTAGKITSQKFVPFNDIGNKYLSSDSIWQSIITSLTAASKNWIFKPILWEFNGDEKAETKLNKRAFQRPYNGRPNYFIIFEVSGIDVSFIHKISFIKNSK
jgi:hypothetical protein